MLDIVVIGAGLSGAIAALQCHAAGARVAVASRGYGATSLSPGALDIAHAPALAQAHGASASLEAHLQDVVRHHPRHPFGQLGFAASRAHIQGGYDLLQVALRHTGLDLAPHLGWEQRNALSISSLGCLIPSAMPLGPHRGWAASGEQAWGVVQIAHDPNFHAERICRGIQYDAVQLGLPPPDVRPFVVHLQSALTGPQTPFGIAQAFDDREICGVFARAILDKIAGVKVAGLILPPVLGLSRYAQARRWLAEDIGLPIIEALGHLPSVPGLRLQRALDAALAEAQIQRLPDVVRTSHTQHKLERLHLSDNSAVDAGAFVLATGRFVSGGVAWTQEIAQEALFGLPLVTELGPLRATSPQSVVREMPAEAHPLMTAGVQVNHAMQPLRDGAPAFDNVFAAGMVLGGFSARYLLCADGVALATGHRAAQGALASCGQSLSGAQSADPDGDADAPAAPGAAS